MGYDAHKLVRGRPLYLGGVKIAYSKGLEGHSDADVLLHALVDALLGAAGLPDIGHYFSNKDSRWKNVSSLVFLQEVARIYGKNRIKILNVDCVLQAEEPKISPHIPDMKRLISKALKIRLDQVGLKASTNEGLGFVGKKQGMSAYAVALVQA